MADALLKQTLQQDLTTALKSRRQVDVAAIRMALAAITTAEVAERRVDTPDGPRTALDTLVIAQRPT